MQDKEKRAQRRLSMIFGDVAKEISEKRKEFAKKTYHARHVGSHYLPF